MGIKIPLLAFKRIDSLRHETYRDKRALMSKPF